MTVSDEALDDKTVFENIEYLIFGTHNEYWTVDKAVNVMNFIDAGGKVLFLGGISYFVLIHYLPELVNISDSNLFSAVNRLVSLFPILVIGLLIALALIAALDFAWQKYDYIKSLRMSHQDVKDEYKETDGQPEVKQKIRKLSLIHI